MREYKATMVRMSRNGEGRVVATFQTIKGSRNDVITEMAALFGEYTIFMPVRPVKRRKPQRIPDYA